ncbi:coiled-coil domain-containing protein [Parabacteroides johnsonii]|uniref:hypothetical protein n=1 Tax=Parabacteroides johnsonii TaxID=387661 RepID=UPI001C391828|nr:hypothetical protein [Parabacteroides johnsonii]MBV4245166.1 hypothetical protein [Parabacteroides johnsonii]
MAGLKINIDFDLNKFNRLVKRVNELKETLNELGRSHPNFNKLLTELENTSNEMKRMKSELLSINTALAHIDLSQKVVEDSKKIRKSTDEIGDSFREYADSINGIKAQMKELTQEFNRMSEAEKNGASGQANINKWAELNAQLKITSEGVRALSKEYANNAIISQAQEGSLKSLRAQLSNLRYEYDNISRDLRNGTTGAELVAQIKKVNDELNVAEQATGRYQRNVGNYASAWNGLNVQVQQVARELPSLAYGLNTFISAIGNNLPMLADEIQRARKEYKSLIAENKKATPVWKQLISSIFNWQTGLVAGITVLALYNKEIIEWTKSLFNAKKTLSETYKTTEEFNKSVSVTSGNVIATLEQLSAGWKKLGGDIKAQEKYILDYKDDFDRLGAAVNSVEEAENILIKGKAAFIESIIAKAKSTSIMKLASEEYVKYLQKMREAEAMPETKQHKYSTATNVLQIFNPNSWVTVDVVNQERKKAEEEAKKYLDSFNAMIDDVIEAEKDGTEKLKNAGIELTNSLVEGSVGAIKAAITQKQQELEKVVDPKEYQRIEDEIKVMQAKLEAITGKSTKKENAVFDQKNRLLEIISKNALERIEKEIELENQAAQERINAMDEGFNKEQAQREFNNKKELQALQRQKEEYIRSYIQTQKEIFEAKEDLKAKQNPNYKKQSFDSSSISVDTSMFDVVEMLTIKRQSADLAKYYKDLLSTYQDYTTKRLEIQKKFNKDRNALEKAGASQERINELEYQRKETLDAIDLEFAQREDSFQAWMNHIANLSLEKLREMLMLAKEELQRQELINPNDPQLAVIRTQVTTLENSIRNKQNNSSPGKRTVKEWQDLYSTLQKVDQEFTEIGDTVGGTIGEIIKAAGNITSSTLQMVDSIVTLASWSTIATKRAAEGATAAIIKVEQASVILTAISAALKIATSIVGLFKRTDYMAEFRKEMAKLNHELEITKLNARIGSDEHNTIFGNDLWKNAKNNIDAAREALQKYNETLNDIANRKVYENISQKIAKAFDIDLSQTFDSLEDSIANMQIQIRHSTWFRDAKYQSLKDAVPELFNEDGSVNMEALEKFIGSDTFKKLSEENQNYLQKMSDDWKVYQDAVEEVKDYLSDIFGDLGNTMMDTIVEAFANGTDAAKSFVDSVSGMLETLAKQMVYSVTLGPLMEKTQEEMLKVMQNTGLSDKQKFDQWTDILNSLVSDAISQQELANKLLEQYQLLAADKGFDIFSHKYSQSSTFGTSLAADQDSVNELNGRFTALQMVGEEIKEESVKQTSVLEVIAGVLAGGNKSIDNLPDISAEGRAIAIEGYESRINVVFPKNEFANIVNGINDVKSIIDEMRTKQVESSMDIQSVAEATTTIAKNNIKIAANTEEIKQSAKHVFG